MKGEAATYTLSSVDGFVLTRRASTQATPKPQLGPEKGVTPWGRPLTARHRRSGGLHPQGQRGQRHDDMAAIVAELQTKRRLARLAANLDA